MIFQSLWDIIQILTITSQFYCEGIPCWVHDNGIGKIFRKPLAWYFWKNSNNVENNNFNDDNTTGEEKKQNITEISNDIDAENKKNGDVLIKEDFNFEDFYLNNFFEKIYQFFEGFPSFDGNNDKNTQSIIETLNNFIDDIDSPIIFFFFEFKNWDWNIKYFFSNELAIWKNIFNFDFSYTKLENDFF